MASLHRDVKGWLNRMLIKFGGSRQGGYFWAKREGRLASPALSDRPLLGQRHQVAVSGSCAAPGMYRITCRSPPAQPPGRTSWPRTVAGAAPGGPGVQAPGAQDWASGVAAAPEWPMRAPWPATVARSSAAATSVARKGIDLRRRTARWRRWLPASERGPLPVRSG